WDAFAKVPGTRGALLPCAASRSTVGLLARETHLSDVVQFLVLQEAVQWVDHLPLSRALNDEAQWVTQSGQSGNRPIWGKGLTGQGQIVAIGDTGMDLSSCFFHDPTMDFSGHYCRQCNSSTAEPCSFSAPQCLSPITSHRKLVAYWAYEDDVD